MIDQNLLRELGWSEDLINAAVRVAEPMREYPAANIPLPDPGVQSVSSSAVYSEAVINNTARALTVQAVAEKPAKKS